MKRVYREVSVRPGAEGFQLLLDERAAFTPARRALVVPTPALAEAMAEEWRRQQERILPDSMPLTQLACTTLDLTMAREAEVQASVAAYGATDLLCYRASAPAALVARQQAAWQPLLDWAASELDAPLAVTEGLVAVEQPEASLDALRAVVSTHRDFVLTALSQLVQLSGSLVIGLAVARDRLSAEAAFEAAELDEGWQMELWGEDEVAMQRRRKVATDLAAAARFMVLARRH